MRKTTPLLHHQMAGYGPAMYRQCHDSIIHCCW